MAKYPSYYVRPDGLHETILRVNGKRKAFRGKTDKEVWEKVKAFDRSREAEKPSPTTFAQAADAWWAEIEPTLAYNTTKGYRPALRRAIETFGEQPVSAITAVQINDYIKEFSTGRARKTVVTQLQVIRQILKKAEADSVVTYNPATAVSPPKNLPKTRRKAPSRAQIQKIKDSADLPFGLFALLIYYTGLRRGEALGLRWEDIDREAKVIYVRRAVYHVGNFPHTKEPKSERGFRTIPLLTALDTALPARFPNGYVFPGEGGQLMKNGEIIKLWKAYAEASGVTATPHQIRHGYATALFEAGIPGKTAQVLLGHAQLSTTMDIYTDVRDDIVAAAAEIMDENF